MSRTKATFFWALILIAVGALVGKLLNMNFWASVALVAAALTLNGWLADREDRGTFND